MVTNPKSKYAIRIGKKKVFDCLLFFYHRKIDKSLEELAKKYNEGQKIIEIGTGTKAPTHKLLFSKSQFIATDIEKYQGIDEILDITQPGALAVESFDLVLCLNVLEHIPDPERAINEMYQSLKTGGELLLVTPFLFPIHDPPHDFYRYTEYGLAKILNGFSEISVKKINLLTKLGPLDRLVLYYIVRAVK